MNQTRRSDAPKIHLRPKKCLVCQKMFPFDKFKDHTEACSRAEQRRIDEARLQQRNMRNSMQPRNALPTKKKEERAIKEQEEGNRFRIKSLANKLPTGNKSKSVFISNKQAQSRINPSPVIPEVNLSPEIKQERILNNSQSTESIVINCEIVNSQHQRQVERQRENIRQEQTLTSPVIIQPRGNANENFAHRQEPNHNIRQNEQTLIQPNLQNSLPNRQRQGYDINALIANSNAIIDFITGINILSEDQTMSAMLGQLQQLNLIAEQIVQLNSIGLTFGSTMGNLFAARIHQLQTVITNQIGIALIRGFNNRLGFQFQRFAQLRAPINQGFTEDQIQDIFPQKICLNRKQCSICLQDIRSSDMMLQLQCFHIFHPSCIKEWLISSRKCPMCRRQQRKNN